MGQSAGPKGFMDEFVADESPFEVDLSLVEEEETEETENDNDGGAPDPERETRLEKKAGRGRLREENENLRQEVAELRGRVEAWTPMLGQRQTEIAQPPQDPELKRLEEEIEKTKKDQDAVRARWASATPQQKEDLTKEYNDLGDKRAELAAERTILKKRPSPQQVSVEETQRQFRSRYPDIAGNEKAFNYFAGTYQRQRAADPNFADNWDTMDRIAAETRTATGLKGYKASEATKRRYGGHAAGGAGGGNEAEKATLEGYERKMARAKYPNDTPAVAYAKFYKYVKKGG